MRSRKEILNSDNLRRPSLQIKCIYGTFWKTTVHSLEAQTRNADFIENLFIDLTDFTVVRNSLTVTYQVTIHPVTNKVTL
jgi:hypothetical protein